MAFHLFQRQKKNKKLEEILHELNMNMENNYKDLAQQCLKDLEKAVAEEKAGGRLEGSMAPYYEGLLCDYKERLKKYTHADQKCGW